LLVRSVAPEVSRICLSQACISQSVRLIAHGRTSYRRVFYRGMHLTEYTSQERVSYRGICLTGLSRGRVSQSVSHRRASSWACISQGVHLTGVYPYGCTTHRMCNFIGIMKGSGRGGQHQQQRPALGEEGDLSAGSYAYFLVAVATPQPLY
jgi:hypothetical protein